METTAKGMKVMFLLFSEEWNLIATETKLQFKLNTIRFILMQSIR